MDADAQAEGDRQQVVAQQPPRSVDDDRDDVEAGRRFQEGEGARGPEVAELPP